MTNRNSIQNSLVWQLLFYKILKPAIDKRRCGSLSVVVYSLLCKLYWKIFYRKYSISGVVTTWHKVPDEDMCRNASGRMVTSPRTLFYIDWWHVWYSQWCATFICWIESSGLILFQNNMFGNRDYACQGLVQLGAFSKCELFIWIVFIFIF